jgi:hypothetical protein
LYFCLIISLSLVFNFFIFHPSTQLLFSALHRYEQQSLAVNDIFPPLPKSPESSIEIKISSLHDKNEDDDSCFTDDDGLQFGEIEY